MVCNGVWASFHTPLHMIILIMGLGYQWDLDFVRPLSLIMQHDQYVIMMVKTSPNGFNNTIPKQLP
jgi:hypothetical protein